MTDNTLLIGKAAEYLFITRCLIEGFICYVPVSDSGRIDVLVAEKLYRCQIKSIQRTVSYDGLPTRKTGGQNVKCYRYSNADVDFMVGADLKTMDVYIVPMTEACKYKAMIAISTLTSKGYKNNFSLFV